MSRQALRYNPELLKRRAAEQVDMRMSKLFGEPVRQIRQRREALDNMVAMLQRVADHACSSGKPNAIIGEDYYVKHNGEYYEVWVRGGNTVLVSNMMQVVTLFDPEKFMSGHVTD